VGRLFLYPKNNRLMQFILFILLMFSSLNLFAQRFCVNANTLNIRSSPNTTSTILARLTNGTEVSIMYYENSEWAYVSVGNKKGYVFSKYLKNCSSNYSPPASVNRNTNSSSYQSTESNVLVCSSPNAYAYHRRHCRGLNRCSYNIIELSLSQAREKNYTPCKICH
jgi:uncharacterized protein YraI